jgi:hypothetical protein
MGRPDEARPFLRRAAELAPGMHRARRLLDDKPVL